MLTDNITASVLDVLTFNQRGERYENPARSFSALSLRVHSDGKYIVKGKSIPFTKGAVCLVPEGVAYTRETEKEQILVIHFSLCNTVLRDILVFQVSDIEKYTALFQKADALWRAKERGYRYRVTALLYEILALLVNEERESVRGDATSYECARYIEENFADPQMTVAALAARFSVSVSLLRRNFHAAHGVSPKRYLDDVRIAYAKSLLETGYFTHAEIAERCGYSDVAYFRTAFKKKTGKCLSEYCYDFNFK